MGTTDARGVYAAADNDPHDPSGDDRRLRDSLGGRIVVPVDNTADRAAKVAALGASPEEPLIVARADAPRGAELEVTFDGVTWSSPGVGPHVAVTRAAAQSIPDATYTSLVWDTELEDTDGEWTVATPTRLTCTRSGVHLVTAAVSVSALWNGRIGLALLRNGTTQAIRLSKADDSVVATVSKQLRLSAGQYVELQLFQNSGGPVNTFTTLESRPTIERTWLRP